MALQELQPLAWDIHEIPDSISSVYTLPLPDQWKDIINRLIQSHKEKDFVPTRSLQAALLAGAPEIIDFNYHAFKEQSPYWLIADQNFHTIDVSKLLELIQQWICFEFGKQGHTMAQRLRLEGVKWEKVDVHILPEYVLKRILPQLIVRELIRKEYRDPQSGNFFQIVPPLNGSQSAEIVSWEPSRIPENPGPSGHSYRLTFSIGRMLGKSTLQLFVDIGLRRWVGTPLITETKNYLPWKINQSVYIARKSISWLSDLSQERTFIKLQLRKESKEVVRWENRIPDFLNQINAADQIPNIKDLLAQPQQYQPDILIVYDQRMGIHHPVGAGVTLNDRKDFFESLNTIFSSHFRFSPSSKWIRQRTLRKQNHLTNLNTDLNQKVVIEIWSKDSDRWENLIKEEIKNDHNKDNVKIIKRDPHPLTKLLDFDPENPNQRLSNAIQHRINSIVKHFEHAKERTGILIEMPNYEEVLVQTEDSERDPKNAVRYGLALTGRLTQFITPEFFDPKSYKERVKNGINDLLRRQMQWKGNALYKGFKNCSLPNQLDLLAFWVITKRRNGNFTIPLISYVPSHSSEIKVCLPGKMGLEWYSYSEALLKMPLIQTSFGEWAIREFFRQAIESLQIENPVLLLLDERNLRQYWGKIKNEELKLDSQQQYIINDSFLHHPKLRIAKLRFSYEKPLNIPLASPTKEVSRFQGLFAPENSPSNVFYSFQEKPSSAKKIKESMRHKDAMDMHFWNPVTAEITLINLKVGDIPAEWAFVVHSLRKGSEHIDSATRLPEPLHSLKCMEEYMVPEELLEII